MGKQAVKAVPTVGAMNSFARKARVLELPFDPWLSVVAIHLWQGCHERVREERRALARHAALKGGATGRSLAGRWGIR